jgi:hypothetical protein
MRTQTHTHSMVVIPLSKESTLEKYMMLHIFTNEQFYLAL